MVIPLSLSTIMIQSVRSSLHVYNGNSLTCYQASPPIGRPYPHRSPIGSNSLNPALSLAKLSTLPGAHLVDCPGIRLEIPIGRRLYQSKVVNGGPGKARFRLLGSSCTISTLYTRTFYTCFNRVQSPNPTY